MGELAEYAVDLLLNGKIDEAKQTLLVEAVQDQVLRAIGETSLLNYMMKFEQYLDDHDIYMFDGWDDAEFVGKPKVETYWVTVYMQVGPKTDLRGAKRVIADKEAQNRVSYKELDDGGCLLRFKVLKRYLDQIEIDEKERADNIAKHTDPTQ